MAEKLNMISISLPLVELTNMAEIMDKRDADESDIDNIDDNDDDMVMRFTFDDGGSFPSVNDESDALDPSVCADLKEGGSGKINYIPKHSRHHHNDTSEITAAQSSSTKNKVKLKKSSGGFQSMNLIPYIFRGIMKKGYRVPTPIQRKVIPSLLSGQDIVAMARTGSGKTAAFLIPMFHKLNEHSLTVGIRALILSPTRELVEQTAKFAKELCCLGNLRICVLVGGESLEGQFETLANNPDIVLATPGRLMHILTETDLSLKNVEYVVYDEADRLFEMGFGSQIRQITNKLPTESQTSLFSATLPKLLVGFARAGLRNPAMFRLDTDSKISSDLSTCFFTIRTHQRVAALFYILDNLIVSHERTIVFAATRYHVEFLHALLIDSGFLATMVYGQLDPQARNMNIAKFRNRSCNILVVTDVAARGLDVAARGLDIPFLENAINFHFPSHSKLFVHRVGRVARAGNVGKAYSLCTPDELPYLVDLARFLQRPLQNSKRADTIGSVSSYMDSKSSAEPILYGNIPSTLLDPEIDHTNLLVSSSSELQQLSRSLSNALQKYISTRPRASVMGIKTAKTLTYDLEHPIFFDAGNCNRNTIGNEDNQTSNTTTTKDIGGIRFMPNSYPEEKQKRQNFLLNLSKYRPSNTILELGAPSIVMQAKRRAHGNLIHRHKLFQTNRHETRQREQEEQSHQIDDDDESNIILPRQQQQQYKDLKNFVNPLPEDGVISEKTYSVIGNSSYGQNINEAVLDITPDEELSIKQRKNVLHWDRKRKKYIHENAVEEREKKSEIKSDIYEKWTKKKKRKIPSVGLSEESGYLRTSGKGSARYKGGSDKTFDNNNSPISLKGNKNKGGKIISGKHARDELVTPEQFRKKRKIQHKKGQKSQNRGKVQGPSKKQRSFARAKKKNR